MVNRRQRPGKSLEGPPIEGYLCNNLELQHLSILVCSEWIPILVYECYEAVETFRREDERFAGN